MTAPANDPRGIGSISGLSLWLRRDGVVPQTAGQPATQWTDASPAGAHAVNTTTSERPTVSGSPVAGIEWSGQRQILSSPASASFTAESVFAAVRPDLVNSFRTIRGGSGNGASGDRQFRILNNKLNWTKQGVAEVVSSSASIPTNTYSIVSGTYSTTQALLYINGTQDGSVNNPVGITAGRTTRIGAGYDGNENFDGVISEVLQFSRVLTAAERAQVHSHLYDNNPGTPKPSDYVPLSTAPSGSAAGTWVTTSTATGQRSPKGAAAGTWATTATATGRRDSRGAAAGTWSTASTATGKTTRRGAAAGTWATVGAASGQTPGVVAPPGMGAAAGTWATAATATGRRTAKGSAAGAWTTKGAAAGPNAYVPNPNDPRTIIAGDQGAPNLAIEVQPDYDVGTFVWDVSDWDSFDLLAWGNASDGWQNVVCDVTSLRIQRGSSRAGGLTDVAEEGTCTIVLADTERRFDPTSNAEAIHAGTPVRIRVWGDTWSEVLFTGRIGQGAEGLQVSYSKDGAPQVTLLATDRVMSLTNWSAVGREEPGVGGGDNLLARVNRVLAEMGWPSSIVATDSDSAFTATLASTTLANAWNVIADGAEAELGRIWVDRNDRIVVRARGSELSGPVRGTLSDIHDEIAGGTVHCCYDDAQVVYGTELLANRAISGRRIPTVDGDTTPVPPVIAQVDDEYSQGRYGVAVVDRKSLDLETDGQLLPWGQAVVLDHTEPELRVNTVVPAPFNAPEAWPAIAATDIGDRWPFRLRPAVGPVVARTLGVLGITHDITPDEWVVTWVTETAPTPGDDNPSGWFTFDLSEWDSDDLLAPIGGAR